jgi:hypothetical protein
MDGSNPHASRRGATCPRRADEGAGLDGVEFDIDLGLEDGECVFSSVSQNWPDSGAFVSGNRSSLPAGPWSKPVGRLLELAVKTVQAFGFAQDVLHVEGKCTTKGARIVEVNARLGGGRIHQMIEPDQIFSTELAEVYVGAKNLRRARSLTEKVLRGRPVVIALRQSDLVRPDRSG